MLLSYAGIFLQIHIIVTASCNVATYRYLFAGNICHFVWHKFEQIIRRYLHLISNLATAEKDCIIQYCSLVKHCWKQFLHTDRGTATMNIPG